MRSTRCWPTKSQGFRQVEHQVQIISRGSHRPSHPVQEYFDNNEDVLRFNVEYLNPRLPNSFPTNSLNLACVTERGSFMRDAYTTRFWSASSLGQTRRSSSQGLVKPGFAMTINKSQGPSNFILHSIHTFILGQTLSHVSCRTVDAVGGPHARAALCFRV